MLKLKLKYFGHLVRGADSLEKTLMLGKIEGRRRRGWEVGWYHQLDGQKFEQALEVGDRQENLACCSSWGHEESDTTELLNWNWIKNNVKWKSSISSQLCPTLCDPMNRSMPGLPAHHQLQEFTQTDVHWVGDAIQLSHPLSSPSPPALNLSNIRVFSNESVLRIRWPKYWSFSFSISPSNEYSGLISFRMDWFDFLDVQAILKSLLQHHSSKAFKYAWS